MGFEFSETMAGTAAWDSEPGTRSPFRFDITVHADSTRDHLETGLATIQGTVYAPPKTRAGPAQGTIEIRVFGKKIIRYQLGFLADDGERYELVGQKDISYLHPFRSFTVLPAEILDGHRRRVATCETRFDLRRHGWSLLRSLRRA